MQGFLIVVVGIGLMYLVLSGKLDCIIAAFRACAGTGGAETPTKTNSLPESTLPNIQAKKILDGVLSF